MTWNIAQAKQKFSEVVRLTAEEPQVIYNRDQVVAVMVDAKEYAAFEQWRARKAPRTLGEAFAELRALAAGDEDPIPLAPRRDRPNAFLAMLDESPD
jgi:PHD/YefM family antitoxin component YafN of YafNO toxin-antitoxin module